MAWLVALFSKYLLFNRILLNYFQKYLTDFWMIFLVFDYIITTKNQPINRIKN